MTKLLFRIASALGAFVLLPHAAGATLMPAWQQKWSTTIVSGMSEPLAARELSDGSIMVIGTGVAAVRYDANGSILSTAVFSPPEFVPFNFSSAASDIAIDLSGTVFISSASGKSSSQGDIWVTAYDGRTGESLWAAPAVFSQALNKSIPVQVLVGADGNPIVVGTTNARVFAGKLDKTTGHIQWEISLAGIDPHAVLDPAGDVILGLSGEPPAAGYLFEAVTYKVRGADGGISWGPVAVYPSVSNGHVQGLAVTANGDFFGAISGPSAFVARYSGADGGTLWGPVAEPPGFQKIEATPAGNFVFLSETAGSFTLTEFGGSNGALLWSSVSQAEDSVPTIRVASDGSVIASALTGDPSAPVVSTWKFAAATGSLAWGPLSLPGSTLGPGRRAVLTIRSDGGIFAAAQFPLNFGAFERDPATGALLWGPTGFTASFVIDGTVTDETQAPDGSIYVTGYSGLPDGGSRWVTLKYSRADGAVVWGPVYQTFQGFSEPYNVRTDSNGNAFVIGYDPDTGHETIVKYAAADGSVLWMSTPSIAVPTMLAVDSNGDVAAVGWMTSAETDFSTVKVSGATGSTLWGPVTYVRAPGHNAFASAIAVTPGGDFVVSGYTIVTPPDPNEWVTLKYSGTTGALLWGPALLGDSSISGNYVQDLRMGADGGVVVAGSSIVNEAQRMTTIKYDGTTGSPVWGPVLAAAPADPYGQANAAAIDSTGNVFVTGYSYNGRSFDFGTVKYRGTDGAVLWGPVLFDGPAGGSDFATAIAIDGAGNPVVAGISANAFKTNDIVTVEYDGATGAQKGAPATLGGFSGHDLPRHNLVASSSSVVLAGTSDTFLTVAYNESDSLYCDPGAPAPVASVSSGPACAGQTVQLTASFYPSATYSWTGPNGFVSSLPNPTLVATAASAGTYSVVIQAYGCTLPTATTRLLVHPPISAVITLDTAALTASVPDAGPGASYAWSVENGSIASGNGTRSITLSLGAGDPVTVRVDVSNASGCTATQTVPVFFDIPTGYWSASQIAKLINDGVSAGCGSHDFCPDSSVTRAQMAIFLLRSKNGRTYNPPAATGTVFADVPVSLFAASWIETLAASGVTSGCGGGNYCPGDSVTRAQIAVFLLRTLHGAAFVPPPATGTVFSDVPASAFAAAWIERLAAEGLTAGCGGGDYCPDATVSRAQMAVFLAQTFNLP